MDTLHYNIYHVLFIHSETVILIFHAADSYKCLYKECADLDLANLLIDYPGVVE